MSVCLSHASDHCVLVLYNLILGVFFFFFSLFLESLPSSSFYFLSFFKYFLLVSVCFSHVKKEYTSISQFYMYWAHPKQKIWTNKRSKDKTQRRPKTKDKARNPPKPNVIVPERGSEGWKCWAIELRWGDLLCWSGCAATRMPITWVTRDLEKGKAIQTHVLEVFHERCHHFIADYLP